MANIFKSLFKYSATKCTRRTPQEDYITQAFVLILERLRGKVQDANIVLEILNFLCANEGEEPFIHDSENLIISADKSFSPAGEIDIALELPQKVLAFIEVKWESSVNDAATKRLHKYAAYLNRHSPGLGRLVLLSKYSEETEIPHIKKNWWNVYHLLCRRISHITDPVNRYLVEQFVSFLEEEGMMTLEKIRNLPTLASLFPFWKLLQAASYVVFQGLKCSGFIDEEYIGIDIIEKRKTKYTYFIGLRLPDGADRLIFEFRPRKSQKIRNDRVLRKIPNYKRELDGKHDLHTGTQQLSATFLNPATTEDEQLKEIVAFLQQCKTAVDASLRTKRKR